MISLTRSIQGVLGIDGIVVVAGRSRRDQTLVGPASWKARARCCVEDAGLNVCSRFGRTSRGGKRIRSYLVRAEA